MNAFDVLAQHQGSETGKSSRRNRRNRHSASRSSDASDSAQSERHSRTRSRDATYPASELRLAASDDDRALLWRHWAAYVRYFLCFFLSLFLFLYARALYLSWLFPA